VAFSLENDASGGTATLQLAADSGTPGSLSSAAAAVIGL